MRARTNKNGKGGSWSLRIKTIPLVVVIALMVGCSDKVWVKEGATQSDFSRDKGLCIEKTHVEQSTSSGAPSEKTADPEKFATCMTDLGYALEYERLLNPRRLWRRD